ncbi:MAG: LPS export ABC transporter periplasmic protein LptC [Candidatus Binatia bacterium]
MRRSRLRAALLTVVAAALAGIGLAVWRNVAGRRPRTVADLGADFLPEVAQHIQNFRRVKLKNGKAVWEVKAEDAQYFEAEQQIVVRKPEVTFFLENGKGRAKLIGSEGRLTLEGKDLSAVTLRGAVVLLIDDLELRADEASYDHARDRISAPGVVTIRGKTLDVRGEGLEVDVEPRLMRLLGDVHTVLRGHDASS